MANRITHELNNILNNSYAVEDYYTKRSLASVASQTVFTADNCVQIESIDMYYRLKGYEVYDDQEGNSRKLQNLASQIVGMMSAYQRCFSVSFFNDSGYAKIYIGAHHSVALNIKQAVSGNLFNPSISNEWIAPAVLDRVQKHSRVIVGSHRLASGDIDGILNTMGTSDCLVSFLCVPCPIDLVNEEIGHIDSFLDSFQRISQTESAVGSGRVRQVHNDNHDILDVMDCLIREKRKLQSSALNGLWQVAVYVSSSSEDGLEKISSALVSAFRSNRDVEKDNVLPQHVDIEYVPIHRVSWSFPNVFVGAENYGGLNGNTLASIVDSGALASIVQFPTLPHKGFSVHHLGASAASTGAFDRFAPEPIDNDSFILGKMYDGAEYQFSVNSLRQHAFVTGTTQYGKSTTVKTILAEAYKRGISFVVIEAAKKDYWRIVRSQGLSQVEVYSFGLDAKPLFINPFKPEDNTLLEYHIQSLINALLSMFTADDPLPQILTNLVYRCYEEKGWNPRRRVMADTDLNYPVLDDLLKNLDYVIDEIDYEDDVKKNMRGVVRVRITSLIRQVGEFLNSERDTNIKSLFDTSAIIELDDLTREEKSFVAGVIALRVNEFSRQCNMEQTLQRLLVLEEAHHLIPNTEQRSITPNRAKCSDYFSDMLAEVSAYGTGLVVVDQRASAVSSATIANTGVKIVHSIREGQDRTIISTSMGLSEPETRLLDQLDVGQAIIAIPRATETCRISVYSNLLSNQNWHFGCLFCVDRKCKDWSKVITPFEVTYLQTNGITEKNLKYCINTIMSRSPRVLNITDKLCIAGMLCSKIGGQEMIIRQKLYDYYERMSS